MTKPMTIEDVLCVYLKNLEGPYPTCFEFHENKERLRAAILAFAAEQVAAATARDSAIIKMVDEARTAGRYSDAEEWDAIDAAIRARAQEE